MCSLSLAPGYHPGACFGAGRPARRIDPPGVPAGGPGQGRFRHRRHRQ